MLRLGCLGDLLRFEKREIEVTALAPDRSSPLELSRFRGRVSDEVFKLSLSPGRGKLPPRSGGVEHSDARDRRLYVRIRNRLTRNSAGDAAK